MHNKMIVTLRPQQQQLIQRMANDGEGTILVSLFEDIVTRYMDVRTLQEKTKEEILARELFCNIMETEVISRFKRKTDNKPTTINEFV